MSAAILSQGKTAIRDRLKPNTGLPTTGLVTHVVICDDATTFTVSDTGINPGTNKSTFAKAATNADVSTDGFDATISITGSTDFTGKVINCIGLAKGTALRMTSNGTGSDNGGTGVSTTIGTDCLSRSVRGSGLGIGVQAGDVFTVGIRMTVEDNS